MVQIAVQLVYLIKLGAVLIAEGVMLQQLTIGKNIQLLIDQSCFLGPYAFEKIYFGIEEA